jgi:Ca-activated chloride channel family protein
MQALLVAFILLATATPIEPWIAARTVIVRGTVKTDAGAPIVGANVYVNDANVSTITGEHGAYLLRVTVPDGTPMFNVRVRALGYQPKIAPASTANDTITIHFTLAAEQTRLDEIVVTGAAEQSVGRATAVLKRGVSHGPVVSSQPYSPPPNAFPRDRRWNTEEYAHIEDNRFLSVASSPLSTFSVDVDRASYTNVRRHINMGTLPPKDAVRIEELINYFSYSYAEPTGTHPVTITTDVAAAPWNSKHRIVRIGLQTKRIQTAKLPPNNLVFLIDVSGSMQPANKLPLVKQAFRLLVNELREEDRVAIVVYAGAAGLVLPSTSAADKQVILDAIERLEAGGSTAGGAGIALAYDVAKQNFSKRGNNRVILATDGDFNVGTSNTGDLVRYVEQRREEGSALTILGFGMGNIKDSRLEQLADKGNGNYAYIDDLLEAKKMFVQEMGATLLTVAKDVKLQIEFNPAAVQAYRLIGYENRLLRNEDFTDDKKDAGDMGAGHSVTALYEVIPVGVELDVKVGTTEPKRYQQVARATRNSRSSELLFVNVRYKPPTDSVSRLLQHAVVDGEKAASDEFRFTMAVAGYGMLLRESEFKGKITYDDVLALAKASAGEDRLRTDFVSLVESTRRIAGGVAKGPSQDR